MGIYSLQSMYSIVNPLGSCTVGLQYLMFFLYYVCYHAISCILGTLYSFLSTYLLSVAMCTCTNILFTFPLLVSSCWSEWRREVFPHFLPVNFRGRFWHERYGEYMYTGMHACRLCYCSSVAIVQGAASIWTNSVLASTMQYNTRILYHNIANRAYTCVDNLELAYMIGIMTVAINQ
jgi:hypothetical protein